MASRRRRALQLLPMAAAAAMLPSACRPVLRAGGPLTRGGLQFQQAQPPDACREGFLAGLAQGGFGARQGCGGCSAVPTAGRARAERVVG